MKPIETCVETAWLQRLKLKFDKPLPSFAFNFNLHPYIKGVFIFCGVLASFLSLGNIGAAILLPILYDRPMASCIQGIVFGYYCPP